MNIKTTQELVTKLNKIELQIIKARFTNLSDNPEFSSSDHLAFVRLARAERLIELAIANLKGTKITKAKVGSLYFNARHTSKE